MNREKTAEPFGCKLLRTALDSNNLCKTVFNSVLLLLLLEFRFFGVPLNVNRNDNSANAKQNNKQKQKTQNETKRNEMNKTH